MTHPIEPTTRARAQTSRASVDAMIVQIAEQHGCTVADVRSYSKEPHHVDARRACYLWLREQGWSLVRIARLFDRDHTSVLHLVRGREWARQKWQQIKAGRKAKAAGLPAPNERTRLRAENERLRALVISLGGTP
jgi:chromosomal replication initiation ATPase DnaA